MSWYLKIMEENLSEADARWLRAIREPTVVGIPPENLSRLFNVDQPLTTPGLENEKGSGLGLIICQEFVRRNGGQIAVSSEVGKGTTFTFTLNRA